MTSSTIRVIINEDEDVSSRVGTVLFMKETLEDGEFPNFVPLSHLNIKTTQGDYEQDPYGEPI